MGLDVYFSRDIANVLRATACASEGSARLALELVDLAGTSSVPAVSSEKLLQAYRQGVAHALISVGLAFGLEPVGTGAQPRSGAVPTLAGMLWAQAPREP